MMHSPGNLYISVAGTGTSEGQDSQLKELLLKHADLTLVLATDNDQPGDKFADKVTAMAPTGMVIQRARPAAKDWNDDLKALAAFDAKQPRRPPLPR
jgi:DNA primase